MIIFGLAFLVFLLTLCVLFGVNGTCAGRCDAADGPLCDLCPGRSADDGMDRG